MLQKCVMSHKSIWGSLEQSENAWMDHSEIYLRYQKAFVMAFPKLLKGLNGHRVKQKGLYRGEIVGWKNRYEQMSRNKWSVFTLNGV